MASQPSRTSADCTSQDRAPRIARTSLRVLVALGLLALLASFDGAEDTEAVAATQPASAELAASQP